MWRNFGGYICNAEVGRCSLRHTSQWHEMRLQEYLEWFPLQTPDWLKNNEPLLLAALSALR